MRSRPLQIAPRTNDCTPLGEGEAGPRQQQDQVRHWRETKWELGGEGRMEVRMLSVALDQENKNSRVSKTKQ